MNILVTAGPTREYFDSVRFISNPSSGKMGFAIAAAALRRGHEVTLIAGPVALTPPPGVSFVPVVSAADMFETVTARFEQCHAVVMTAAVCDYRPVVRLDHKLKKESRPRTVELEPTEDILAHLGRIRTRQVLIGFAMEDRDARRHAEDKLKRKGCDAIVLNGLANVGSDEATVDILRADGGWSSPLAGTKEAVANAVMDLAESLHGARIGH